VLKASEVLATELLTNIVTGGLQPGDRLPQETEMIEHYGVGRSTVREAIRILEVNGLVDVRSGPGGGPTVRGARPVDFGRMTALFLQADRVTLAEVLEARKMLEPVIVREATLRRDPSFLRRVADLRERSQEVDVSRNEDYARITREFHELIASASCNRVLGLFGFGLMSMFIAQLDRAYYPRTQRKDTILEHNTILTAILKGEAARAAQLMSEHMEHFIESIATRQPDAYHDIIRWR
jgi:DNA-binding FadR family transcriptional regulator